MFILKLIDRFLIPTFILILILTLLVLWVTYPDAKYGNYWTGRKLAELERRIERLEQWNYDASNAET